MDFDRRPDDSLGRGYEFQGHPSSLLPSCIPHYVSRRRGFSQQPAQNSSQFNGENSSEFTGMPGMDAIAPRERPRFPGVGAAGLRDQAVLAVLAVTVARIDAVAEPTFKSLRHWSVSQATRPRKAGYLGIAPTGCVSFPRGGGRRIGIWVLAHGSPCDGTAGPIPRRLRLARPSSVGGAANRLARSNRRVRTRKPGGVGGEEPRGSPLSRSMIWRAALRTCCSPSRSFRIGTPLVYFFVLFERGASAGADHHRCTSVNNMPKSSSFGATSGISTA